MKTNKKNYQMFMAYDKKLLNKLALFEKKIGKKVGWCKTIL